MLEELRNDNESLVASMRETHALCDEKGDVCTESLNPGVMVMKSTKDGMRFDASCRLNRARDRRIFVQ